MQLIDTNVIIRLLTADHEKHYQRALEIFRQIETKEIDVIITESVLAEVFFVLTKLYKVSKIEVIRDLKSILSLAGIVGENKIVLFETLNILSQKNIDFIDALLCAKSNLENLAIISFDHDIKKCYKNNS